MHITFIAHAGISVEENGHTILIDPWFTDSTLERPILEGLSGIKTIDFQIPKTKEQATDYSPDILLLSHFHAHHSPLHDIVSLIKNSTKNIDLAYPDCSLSRTVKLRLSQFENIRHHSLTDNMTFTSGPFTITAYTHTVPGHLAWSVKSETGHILHIADAKANIDTYNISLHESWEKFTELKPDIVFMSAGRNSIRQRSLEKHSIAENVCFSPVQGAALIQKLQPQIACSIGTQNHSIWKNNTEFIPENSATEDELRWAIEWVAPQTKYIPIRPGHIFSLNEPYNKDALADTYLTSIANS